MQPNRGLLRMSSTADIESHRFSVAPMMEYTDRHQRYLFSLLSKKSVLYTEMVTANALMHNKDDVDRFLEADFDLSNPLVLQLGGSDPAQMNEAAKIARNFGYNEVNINCGCPSDKVAGKGSFGAALMREPQLVADLCKAVGDAMGKPPTVKCRIGVNDEATYEKLHAFVTTVHEGSGVMHFIVHARAAILGAKFSPHDNRTIPPLKYDYVYRLVKDFPNLQFTLNGGVLTYEDTLAHLAEGVQGVMVGRQCVSTPFYWARVDSKIYGVNDQGLCRRQIIDRYGDYAQAIETSQGPKARRALMKPLLGMFVGEPRGKVFRARMDVLIRDNDRPIKAVFTEATECLKAETLDAGMMAA